MSHTNHRQGSRESLHNTFATIAMGSQGINTEGVSEKLQQFLRIATKHNPVNAGNMKVGNLHVVGSMEALSGGGQGSIVQAAFNSMDNLAAFLTDLKKADLGVSIIITGLFDETKECCNRADLHRHTVEYSLGVFGKTEKLPDPAIMEITTMCGHGQVSFGLVDRMVKDVTRGMLTMEEATMVLTKPCICGIVDPTRVRRLLEKMVAKAIQPTLRNYIAMDPGKCDKCYACEVACVEAHPNNNGQAMCIVDASIGPAISLHCMHCADAPCMKACTTGNIVRDAETGAVYMKGDRCIGCKLCVSACPFGMIVWDQQQGQSHKCDLCVDRLQKGEAPACVAGCPTGALSTPDDGEQFKRRRTIALQATLASIPAMQDGDGKVVPENGHTAQVPSLE